MGERQKKRTVRKEEKGKRPDKSRERKCKKGKKY